MTEPDVTLTDYALALECGIFCALASRWPVEQGDPSMRRWWVAFFASVGLASLVGGTVHGFFLAPGPMNGMLWRATLLCLGVTSLTLWIIGARARLRPQTRAWVQRVAIALLMVYAIVVLFVDSRFIVAIAAYAPATAFMLAIMATLYARTLSRSLALAIFGLLLTFVAAGVQQLGVAIHPVYLNHNALYHVIQGVALWLIYIGARWMTVNALTLQDLR